MCTQGRTLYYTAYMGTACSNLQPQDSVRAPPLPPLHRCHNFPESPFSRLAPTREWGRHVAEERTTKQGGQRDYEQREERSPKMRTSIMPELAKRARRHIASGSSTQGPTHGGHPTTNDPVRTQRSCGGALYSLEQACRRGTNHQFVKGSRATCSCEQRREARSPKIRTITRACQESMQTHRQRLFHARNHTWRAPDHD